MVGHYTCLTDTQIEKLDTKLDTQMEQNVLKATSLVFKTQHVTCS